MNILVTGAGGFIGHHLVQRLAAEGHQVRGVDSKRPEFAQSAAAEFLIADLRDYDNCRRAVADMDDVYQLAADMGGIGYITANLATLSRNNILINCNMLEAARLAGVRRYLYSSSACVYPVFRQQDAAVTALREDMAIPADPEQGYGWEKLFAERLTAYYCQDWGLDVRIVRFHNIYGPLGAYDGGKEKAPAALCRKVFLAPDGGDIEIWGDGRQTRSFCYIDDCIEGLRRIMESGCTRPLNLGTEELITVDQLVDAVCAAAGKDLRRRYDRTKPQGVRGRNSDNTLLQEVTGWQPAIGIRQGIHPTYHWIAGELAKQAANPGLAAVAGATVPANMP